MKKISRREFLTVVAAASAAGLLSACGGSSGGTTSTSAAGGGAASGQSINLRIASSSPTVEFEGDGTTALGISALYFVNQISARTDGRITAQIFPDGQIASSTQEYIGGLQNGAFDIGILNCGSWGDYTSAFAGLNMPYLYLNYDEAYAVLDSEVGQSWLQKAQEDTTTIPLAFFDIGFRELTCNNEVHTPDDLKGVKIRVMPDPIQTATWEALGCAVTPVAYSELYTALQQGMVDAQENPPSNIVSSKLYELQKYCMKTNHNFTTTIMAASPVFWSQISDADKELIAQTWKDTEMYVRSMTSDLSDGFFQTMSENGTTVVELTPDELKEFQDVAKTVWPKIEESMGSEAYNKLIDFVMDYQANK